MNLIDSYLHFILHLNTTLPHLFQSYGNWIYGLVFLLIFLENGIILTPFLPGESMLFVLGTLTGVGGFSPHNMVLLLAIAAALGGFVNYGLGFFIGQRILYRWKVSWFKHGMIKTTQFYQKYGPMAILLARLVPIIRTFVPFFAGVAKMRFDLFSLFNLVGAVIWITVFLYLGFFFGKIPMVQSHFSWIVLAIIFLSIIPIGMEIVKILRRKNHAAKTL